VEIQTPDGKPISMVVTPANSLRVGDTSYTITDINPNWSLMSGDDVGKEAYTVSVSVQKPETSFVRQLIAGYPEYTEDIVESDDPSQPMARAKNVLGRPLVDESLQMSLEYDAKDTFYVTQSGALYLREIANDGTPLTSWIERPITNLPRFNDYISGYDDVWSMGNQTELHPLNLHITSSEGDPVNNDIVVTSYLRYAYMNSRIAGGGDELFPVAWVTLKKGEEATQSVELYAFDPSLSTADTSLMTFRWLGNNKELDVLEQSLVPSIKADIFGKSYDIELAASDDFQQIGDTEYACKINSMQNNLNIGGTVVSLAIVSIKHGDQTWDRWVFDNKSMNRDVIEGEQHTDTDKKFIDENISMTYSAGGAPITIVGGTEDNGYRLLTTISGNTPTSEPLEIGKPFPLTEDVTLTIDRVEPYTFSDTRPTIVPVPQRDPSASNMYSMVKAVVPTQEGTVSAWLPYHHYPFESQKEVVRRFQYKPTTIQLSNGKFIELMFSRKRAKLSAPVALDSFEVDSHLGGFTGSTSSILNWRSVVKFLDGSDETMAVSVNDPKPHKDLWFFQSQWDPPDAASKGLNYTVLGVGNRHGVFPMLLGCCLTVAGMVWAFYIKPLIKRKRQQAIYSEVQK
jgi:hypothetical protein